MPEEAKKNETNASQPNADTSAEKSAKSGMMKYLLFGGGIVVVICVVAVVALLMFGGSSSTTEETSSAEPVKTEHAKVDIKPQTVEQPTEHQPADQSSAEVATEGGEEVSLDDFDASAIEKIMENLNFLDYEPSEDEMASDEGRMTKDDSLEQVNWLDKEKQTLEKRVKELDAREKDLAKREAKIDQAMVKLEQVESTRIASLAKLYDGMDSRAVANLLANLDDETVVSILPRMKVKNASAVLQLMPAQRAAKLSKQMITIAENK